MPYGPFAVALAEGRDPGWAVRFACAAAGISVRAGPAAFAVHAEPSEVEALLAED